jgi:hypothetical protein
VEAAVRRRRVVVVWLVFAALLGVVAAVEYRDVMASRSARGTEFDTNRLVPVPLEQLGAVEIADAGTLHRFERDATGAWFYHGAHGAAEATHAHASDPAAAARIDQALQGFGRGRMERRLPAGSDPRAYGLTAPTMLILIYRGRDRQPLAQYAVGDVAADTVSRYVDVVGVGMVTIPSYQIDNLRALVGGMAGPPAAR